MNKNLCRSTMVVLLIAALGSVSMGQTTSSEPETYSRLSLSLGGYYYSGNLNQVQGNLQGHYGLSSPTNGVDVLFNGYRLWSKANKDAVFKVVGDDAHVTALPFWYLSDEVYLAGLARYESSRIQRLNTRYIGGAGVGYAPVRTKTFLIRMSIIPTFEYATFDGEDFRIDVTQDGPNRQVTRAAFLSNGWYRVEATAVTFRYFGQLWMSPKEPKDFRANLTGNMDIKITAPLAFRTTINLNHDSAILVGREPTDIRSTFGFVWTSQ